MPRLVYKIEAQIRIFKSQQAKLRPDQINSWHKLNNKIISLNKELVEAKNFEYLAR